MDFTKDENYIKCCAEYDRLYGGKPEDTLENFAAYMDEHYKHEPTKEEIAAADAHYEEWKKAQPPVDYERLNHEFARDMDEFALELFDDAMKDK